MMEGEEGFSHCDTLQFKQLSASDCGRRFYGDGDGLSVWVKLQVAQPGTGRRGGING